MSASTYRLVRGAARFATLRHGVVVGRKLLTRRTTRRFVASRHGELAHSAFPDLDVEACAAEVRRNGLSERLTLRPEDVAAIVDHAATHQLYADREPHLGFAPGDREITEERLGKPILVAQYMNTRVECPTIDRLANDPALALVAAGVLGSIPSLVGTSLWWTYPVDASDEDRNVHAHLFHRDVDDFAFVKFFFYLTPVEAGDGGHVCVVGSHRRRPPGTRRDGLVLRRYTDHEVESTYSPADIREIVGDAGSGFAENTLCLHKGLTPTRTPRLLLQFEYALFDHHVMNDERPTEVLHALA